MKTKQYSIKVFELEIEDNDNFFEFIKKYQPILKKYLLVLNGNVTEEIRDYLQENNLAFTTDTSLQSKSKAKPEHIKNSDLKIIDTLVRSGTEITTDSDILVLNRVNSGSIIKTNGNFLGLSLVDGKIESNGDFMFIKKSSKAMILFNGADITNKIGNESFYIIKQKGNKVAIEKYKKDIKWV
jgi:hypothetical protein